MRIAGSRYNPVTRNSDDVRLIGPSGTPLQRELEQASLANPSQAAFIKLIEAIKHNTDIQVLLQTIGLAFTPRTVTVAPSPAPPTQIIVPNQAPRGYIIVNPAELSGFSQNVTFLASALRVPATYTSTSFNVSGVYTARFFLDVTVQAAGATLQVNAQTQDPLSGNWADSQLDIFGGNAAVGTYYASIGSLGVDQAIRLQAIVGVNDETFSISGVFKGGINTPVGSTIYLGGPDVNTTFGYPLLAGDKEYKFLLENVGLYGITATNSLNLKIFQLQ